MVWRSSRRSRSWMWRRSSLQVDDDAVGPGQLRQGGGGHRVGFVDEPGLAQGGNMVNVHFQSRHAGVSFQ